MVSRGQTLEVRFLGDVEDVLRATRSMNRELGNTEDAQKKVAASSDRMGGSWRDTFASLERAQVPLLAMNAALIGMAAGAIKFASDLGEARSAVEVTFGESQQTIEAFAQTSASAYGVSKRAANEYAASLGGIFNASGLAKDEAAELSVQAIKLAADLGSLRNLGVDEALEKIRSGLVGEAEPLRTVGVLLSEAAVQAKAAELGLGGLRGELTEGEKVRARFAIITEQLNVAEGNFANTLGESLPNQAKVARAELENAAATLGEKLLPLAITATEALTTLVTAFAAFPEPVQLAVIGVSAFSAGILGLLALLPNIIAGVGTLTTTVMALNAALIANPVVLAAVGVAAVGAGLAWATYTTLNEAASFANQEFAKTAQEAAASMDANVIRDTILQYEFLRDAIEADIVAFRAQGQETDALEQHVVELNGELENLRGSLQNTAVSAEELGLAEAATRGPTEVLAAAMDQGAVSASRYAGELQNLTAKALAAQLALQTTADGTPEEMDARFEDAVTRVRRQLARDASTEREIQTILQAADPTGYFDTERQLARPGLGQVLPTSSRSSGGAGGGSGGSGSSGISLEEQQRLAIEEANRITAERELTLVAKQMAEAEIAAVEAIKQRTEVEKEAAEFERQTLERAQAAAAFAQNRGATNLASQRAIASMFGFRPPEDSAGTTIVDVVVP